MIQDPEKLPSELLSLMEIPPISVSKSADPKISCGPRGNPSAEEKRDLARLRFLSNEEREEEELYGVSTELTLYTDPWSIKKKLSLSDCSHQNRLVLNASSVHRHILRYLLESCQKMFEEGYGLTVNVYDHDSDSKHIVRLKNWPKRRCFFLCGGWFKDFVCRRDLKNGDEIGMFWDRFDSKLHFRVLSRALMGVSSGSVPIVTPLLEDPSQAPIGVSSGSVPIATPLLEDPSLAPIGVSSGSVPIAIPLLADPSLAPIGVSPRSVPVAAPLLADPSLAPIGVSSGSVTKASYPSLLADP